jgi:hypothetical protein
MIILILVMQVIDVDIAFICSVVIAIDADVVASVVAP